MEANTEKLYIVQQVNWHYNDMWFVLDKEEGRRPLKAFRSREKAERYCEDMLIEFWTEFDSLYHAIESPEHGSSLSEAEVHRRIQELVGWEPTEPFETEDPFYYPWADEGEYWWGGVFKALPRDVQVAVCNVFDKVKPFVVLEVEPDTLQ